MPPIYAKSAVLDTPQPMSEMQKKRRHITPSKEAGEQNRGKDRKWTGENAEISQ